MIEPHRIVQLKKDQKFPLTFDRLFLALAAGTSSFLVKNNYKSNKISLALT